jgi:hypothetical protein
MNTKAAKHLAGQKYNCRANYFVLKYHFTTADLPATLSPSFALRQLCFQAALELTQQKKKTEEKETMGTTLPTVN